MSKPASVPQSALHGSTPDMEAAVNDALRRVVNDGEPLASVLDTVFHAGFSAGYRVLGENVTAVARSLTTRAARVRAGRELGDTDPGDYALGLEDARSMLRRYTGIA